MISKPYATVPEIWIPIEAYCKSSNIFIIPLNPLLLLSSYSDWTIHN